MTDQEKQRYKWYILALVVLTDMIVVAMPSMGLSVLSKEISESLGLNLVQVGFVWGLSSMPAIFSGFLGGVIGDRLGPKRVLVFSTLVTGLLCAARALAVDFASLSVLVLLHGAMLPVLVMNCLKTNSQWFSTRQLGLANGLHSMGMAFGFLTGSFLSSAFLSPLLGGWRNVHILYGALAVLLTIPWIFARTPDSGPARTGGAISIKTAARHVAGLKNVWLLAFALFGVNGAVQGILGYLPLYLRGLGWQPIQADGAVSAFHTISLVCVIPLILFSNRFRSRKVILITAGTMVALGSGLLSLVTGGWIWPAVLITGFVRDGFMALFFTALVEVDGVGATYAGTAIGVAQAVNGLGNWIAPPLGNSFAFMGVGAPFAFWSGLAVVGITCLALIRRPAPVIASPVDV